MKATARLLLTLLLHGDKDKVAPYPMLEKGEVCGHINNDRKLFLDAVRGMEAFLSAHIAAAGE